MNLLVDYAEVISHPLADDAIGELASLAGLPEDVFRERYWAHRVPYDTGGTAEAFWATVLERPVGGAELEELIRVDVAGWTQVNADTVGVLREVHDRGHPMALLSNAPHELADAVEALPELGFLDSFVFSARIGFAKPDPRAFAAALDVMGLPAGEVVFVDDREANVAGAREAGLDARLYTDADALRAELLG